MDFLFKKFFPEEIINESKIWKFIVSYDVREILNNNEDSSEWVLWKILFFSHFTMLLINWYVSKD